MAMPWRPAAVSMQCCRTVTGSPRPASDRWRLANGRAPVLDRSTEEPKHGARMELRPRAAPLIPRRFDGEHMKMFPEVERTSDFIHPVSGAEHFGRATGWLLQEVTARGRRKFAKMTREGGVEAWGTRVELFRRIGTERNRLCCSTVSRHPARRPDERGPFDWNPQWRPVLQGLFYHLPPNRTRPLSAVHRACSILVSQ